MGCALMYSMCVAEIYMNVLDETVHVSEADK